MKGVVKMSISPVEHIVNVLTPTSCIICQREGEVLCTGCAVTALPEVSYRCYMCNKLMVDANVCSSCRSRSHLRRVWWLGPYSTELKSLVWNIKYQRSRSTARTLARYLAGRLPYIPQETLVVPVPTASSRVRRRGYDQAFVIARQLAETLSLESKPLLRRRDQADLIGLRRLERLRQMEDSFAPIALKKISGSSILLIDDVLTTGVTLEAAAALLRKHGAKHVDAAVLTRRLLN
jgi:ComF family protein